MGLNHTVLCEATQNIFGNAVSVVCIVKGMNMNNADLVNQAKALFGEDIEIR